VVIVGGGFGGLYAARGLARAPVRVTVVDRYNYHLFRPMLYQVATGLLSADEIAAPIRSILRKQQNTEVLLAEVTGVDTQGRRVLMGEDGLPYDYLVLATGVHYNYFGHEEWKDLALSLTSVVDADRIRAKLLHVFETAERLASGGKADAETIQEWLTFAVVGAGPTGVELVGAISELSRAAMVGDFRHIDTRSTRILLFEAGPRILTAFPEELAEKSRRRLEQIGVEVQTGAAVERVDAEGVVVRGQRIRCRTVLWAAGVVASPAGQWLGAEVDRAGRVKVNPDLSVPGHPEVFVIGDTATVVAPVRDLLGRTSREPEPVPGLAPPACQEGAYAASAILRRVRGLAPPGPFVYKDKGNLAIVGRSFAVADLKFLRFWGRPAWWLWLLAHIFYLIGFANRLLVMTQWAISFVSNRRGVRIFPSAGAEASVPVAHEDASTGEHRK
jgi:NADH dehydrogenase